MSSPALPPDVHSNLAELSGTVLESRYQLGRILGAGGMGAVFEATHLRLDRKVAIKVLRPVFVGHDEFIKRFLREAKTASKIRHRNVVDILDFGEAADGLVYSVMEFLEGQDLEQLCRSQPGRRIPWTRACGLLVQIASGLRAAHAAGVTHRDIKPANCFLTEEDGQPLIKVVDFGIAKVDEADQSQQLTGTSQVLGTPNYIAPELVRTKSPANPQSDIYSLGVLAYRILTGRLPFTGETAFEILRRSCFEPIPPLRSHVTDLPEELETFVLSLLAKEPARRPSGMEAVRDGLLALSGTLAPHAVQIPPSAALPVGAVPAEPVTPPGFVAPAGPVDPPKTPLTPTGKTTEFMDPAAPAAAVAQVRSAPGSPGPMASTLELDAPLRSATKAPDEPTAHATGSPSSTTRTPTGQTLSASSRTKPDPGLPAASPTKLEPAASVAPPTNLARRRVWLIAMASIGLLLGLGWALRPNDGGTEDTKSLASNHNDEEHPDVPPNKGYGPTSTPSEGERPTTEASLPTPAQPQPSGSSSGEGVLPVEPDEGPPPESTPEDLPAEEPSETVVGSVEPAPPPKPKPEQRPKRSTTQRLSPSGARHTLPKKVRSRCKAQGKDWLLKVSFIVDQKGVPDFLSIVSPGLPKSIKSCVATIIEKAKFQPQPDTAVEFEIRLKPEDT